MANNIVKRELEEVQESSAKDPNDSFKRIKSEVRDDFQEVILESQENFQDFNVLSYCGVSGDLQNDSKESDDEHEEDDFSDAIANRVLHLFVRKAQNKYTAPFFSMKTITFSKLPGLKKNPDEATPIAFFNFLLTDEFYNHTIEQSNIYAKTFSKTKKSTKPDEKDFTISELRTFIGLILHMGTIKIQKINDYWKKSRLFNLTCFIKHMSKARFFHLLQNLNFSQNSGLVDHPYDQYQKINWIVDYFNKKMEEVYYPQQKLSVSESSVLEGSKLCFETERSDVKLYLLSERNGPILRMMVHTERDVLTKRRKQSMIVLSMMKGMLDNGHSLFLNSHFTSWALVTNLVSRNTHCTGTLSEKRKINIFDKVKLGKSEVAWMIIDDVIVGKWRGERDVLFVSSEYPTDIIVNVKKPRNIVRPVALSVLKEVEEETESNNKILNLFAAEKDTLPWHRKLAIHMIEILLFNAWYLYKKSEQNTITFYEFRLSVIENLLFLKPQFASVNEEIVDNGEEVCDDNNLPDPQEVDPLANDPLQLNMLNHFPFKRKNRKRCRQCYKSGNRKDTNVYCPLCKGDPGLCLDPCFREYHFI